MKELKRPDEALASYDKALAIDPGYQKAWTNRGAALCDLARYQEAVASQEKALAINPGAVEAWTNRGIALGRLRQYEAALASYDRALAIDPASAETWSNRGNALAELKRYGDAVASFDKVLAINRGSAETWVEPRQRPRRDRASWPGLLGSFEEALRIDPRHAEAWYNRGIAMSELQPLRRSPRKLRQGARHRSRDRVLPRQLAARENDAVRLGRAGG